MYSYCSINNSRNALKSSLLISPFNKKFSNCISINKHIYNSHKFAYNSVLTTRQFSTSVLNQKEEPKNDLSSNKYSIAQNSIQKQVEDWSEIISRWYQNYLDFVGITTLTLAQERVKTVTADLIDIQRSRRDIQTNVERLQKEVVGLHLKMSKTEMFSDEHVRFFDQARNADKLLRENQENFTKVENDERDTFTRLTAAISDCHEKEKSQAQNSKYWSIVFSVISAALASVVTSVNNWIRIKEIKEHANNLNEKVLTEQHDLKNSIMSFITSCSNKEETAQVPDYESIKNTIVDTISNYYEQHSKIIDSVPVKSVEVQTHPSLPDHSIGKIAFAMGVGAVIGTLLTSTVFGSSGG